MQSSRFLLFAVATLVAAPQLASAAGSSFPITGPVIPGSQAALRGGVALAPALAPTEVKRATWTANELRCSGTISYALGAAGVVQSPMSSSDFRRFGARGQGKWITVYARNGHTFAVIAGLRLDTTAWNTMRRDRTWAPRWQATPREPRGFEARHPAGL